MQLEFRTKDGVFMFTLIGEAAHRGFVLFQKTPELVLTEKMLKKVSSDEIENFKIFKCIKRCGYNLFESIGISLDEGDYIKVTH